MSKNKTKHSTVVVTDNNGKVICYLTLRDEERGLDAHYNLMGYNVSVVE